MSFVYYNEWDDGAARWLRELIRRGMLPDGEVDTRSITEVDARDLKGFTSWHFFAGIGGWPLALRLAGIPDDFSILTGSPPCQPFSVAGLQKGKEDERHLAPVWLDIIRQHKPERIAGEQVEAAIGKGWLDDLFDALEHEGYACGAAVLPACSVGAPHIRKRLFFGAVRLADANGRVSRNREEQCGREHGLFSEGRGDVREGGERSWTKSFGLADTDEGQCRGFANSEGGKLNGPQTRWIQGDSISQSSSVFRGLADTDNARPQGRAGMSERADEQPVGARSVEGRPTDPDNRFWSGADWLGCRDGKFRPVEPGTQPLVDGLPKGMVRGSIRSLEEQPGAARVMRLRGYGNAIVPQVAATFVQCLFESIETMQLLGDL